MSQYARGARAERRTQRACEREGFVTIRAAGSHGPIDVAAFDGRELVLITVKSGRGRLSPAERRALARLPVPLNARLEYWHWPRGARAPRIEVLETRA